MELLAIDHESDVPPFEQLRTQIAGRAARGELAPGTRLPTVRAAAGELGLAVNTVARAYRELEADGVLVTEGRRGTFVRSRVVDGTSDGGDLVHRAAADYARTARRAGLGRAEAIRLLERAWEGRR
ncbi:MAG TPA: GntR family transcriptional regulator [Nocardioidaceae bacterium]